MDLTRLLIGLSLPWLAGFFCLRTMESRLAPGIRADAFRQLGYGLFLGYAGVQGLVLVSARLFGSVDFWLVSGVIGLIAVGGAWLSRKSTAAPFTPQAAEGDVGLSSRAFTLLLLALIAIHLWLTALEILNRPVYPWDAWLAWVYRAKAWFFSGTVYGLAPAADWLAGTTISPYTIDAYQYPTFASVVPFWAALSLGHWSETLVNTPVLLCAVALGLALYGQCREIGLGFVPSLAAAYFLLSVPLVGTHLSLAGYADIWMAGFTGLGFVSLLRASAKHNRVHLFLGLLMVAIGAAVKNEGMVWLYIAIILAVLTAISTRALLIVSALVVVLGAAAWITGVTGVDLPGAGTIGLQAGYIHIPLVGGFKVQTHPVWGAYQAAILQQDSWNLLWFLVIAAALAMVVLRLPEIRKSVLIFLGLFVASQLVIFGMTEQGAWAETFTAINRLPLHFVPAMIFTVCLVLAALAQRQSDANGPRQDERDGRSRFNPAIPAAVSALAVVTGLVASVAFRLDQTGAAARVYTADRMNVAVGSGELTAERLEISAFKNGAAIVSTGTLALNADLYDMLEYRIFSDSDRTPMFFWRSASSRGLQMAPLYSDHRHLLLEDLPGWNGRITEAGIALFGDQTTQAGFVSLSLSSKTLATVLQSMLGDWSSLRPWTPKSINFNLLGPDLQPVRLALLATVWLSITLVLSYFLSRGALHNPSTLATFMVIAWLAQDAVWLHNRIGRLENTLRLSDAAREVPHIDIGFDKEIAQLVAAAREDLDRLPTARVLVVAESDKNQYEALRAKYHLLPHAAVVTDTQDAKQNLSRADALLFIPDQNRAAQQAKEGQNPADIARQAVSPNLSEIAGSDYASIMRTERASAPARP